VDPALVDRITQAFTVGASHVAVMRSEVFSLQGDKLLSQGEPLYGRLNDVTSLHPVGSDVLVSSRGEHVLLGRTQTIL
jgi:hypothetical protein